MLAHAAPGTGAVAEERGEQRVAVAGSARLAPLIAALAAAFRREVPGADVTVTLRGAGVDGLTARVADVAIVDRVAWEAEQRPFRQVMGALPAGFRIGIDTAAATAGRVPPSVYVNRDNPIAALSLDRLARIMTSGAGSGDIVRWGQAGLDGAFADRRIHLYGLRDGGGFATNLRLELLAKRQYAPAYEALANAAAVIEAVAADRYGIAVLDEQPATAIASLKRVTLTDGSGRRDPLAPYVRVYLARPARARPNVAAVRFLRFALSPAGQRVIAGQARMLDAADLAGERARLEAMADAAR